MQAGCGDALAQVVLSSVGDMGDVAVSERVNTSDVSDVDARSAPSEGRARRRFVAASIIGVVVAAVPFLWNLWGTWQSPDFFRTLSYQANFYDIQAKSMLHGHLTIPPGSIGVEAFVVNGHTSTYFGLFPSILRLPFVEWAPSLFGRLSTPSMLVAWLVSASVVIGRSWRVRVMGRGDAALGWAEAISFGALTATIQAGSVFLLLAATPYVFNEDLAWSIALTVGCLFVLVGIMQRPPWGRVVAIGFLLTAADLDRLMTGWAAILGTARWLVSLRWVGAGSNTDGGGCRSVPLRASHFWLGVP